MSRRQFLGKAHMERLDSQAPRPARRSPSPQRPDLTTNLLTLGHEAAAFLRNPRRREQFVAEALAGGEKIANELKSFFLGFREARIPRVERPRYDPTELIDAIGKGDEGRVEALLAASLVDESMLLLEPLLVTCADKGVENLCKATADYLGETASESGKDNAKTNEQEALQEDEFKLRHFAECVARAFRTPAMARTAGRNALTAAVASGRSEILRLLLDRLKTNDSLDAIDRPDGNGATPLGLACEQGESDCASMLLRCGADPNALNQKGEPPFFAALNSDKWTTTCELLTEAGADLNLMSATGRTALCVALASGDPDKVEALLARGAEFMWNAGGRHRSVVFDVAKALEFAAVPVRIRLLKSIESRINELDYGILCDLSATLNKFIHGPDEGVRRKAVQPLMAAINTAIRAKSPFVGSSLTQILAMTQEHATDPGDTREEQLKRCSFMLNLPYLFGAHLAAASLGEIREFVQGFASFNAAPPTERGENFDVMTCARLAIEHFLRHLSEGAERSSQISHVDEAMDATLALLSAFAGKGRRLGTFASLLVQLLNTVATLPVELQERYMRPCGQTAIHIARKTFQLDMVSVDLSEDPEDMDLVQVFGWICEILQSMDPDLERLQEEHEALLKLFQSLSPAAQERLHRIFNRRFLMARSRINWQFL